MSSGIPTSLVPKPGAITVPNGVDRALISDLQLLTPQFYSKYTEKYGNEDFTMWLATFGGMEEVKNREFFWFQNKGRNQLAVSVNSAVTGPAAGVTVTVEISAEDMYDSDSSPLRVGETVRIASSNIEGKILTVNTGVNPQTCTIRPLRSSEAFVSAGSANLLAGEVLLLAGITDAGEASDTNDTQVHLDEKKTNTITEIRDTFSATDLAEMTEVFYSSGVSGSAPAGGGLAGPSFFTLKGLFKTNQRFKNNIEFKLMRGNVVNNISGGTSVGSKGIIPQVEELATEVNYSAGSLDISKLHEITRSMDVQGCAKQNVWLMDIYQKQNFSDGLYKDLPAGAWVWGSGEKSKEASLAYGFESVMIDGYLFQTKKYTPFNTEAVYGKTPANDYFRDYGLILPQGEARDTRNAANVYKNISIMYQQPPAGGTIGNGIRVWRWGGGSQNPTSGKMEDNVEMICYRSTRVVAGNQAIIVRG